MKNLDEKIGQALGLPFWLEYLVMDAAEEGYFIRFGWKHEADEWLRTEVERQPDGHLARDGAHVVERRRYPLFSGNLQDAKAVVDEMGQRGFWLKLVSPFVPTEEQRPKNPAFWPEWERTRNYWSASFDFHGTVDSRPLWRAESENPAEAIILAALQCIDGNPELFIELPPTNEEKL